MHLSCHTAAIVFSGLFLALLSCRTIDSSRVKTAQLDLHAIAQTPELTAFLDGEVEVENVSFRFDRDFVQRVEVSEVPAEKLKSEDVKPDNIGGRALEFTLKYSGSNDQASISVFKISEYKEAFALFPQYHGHRDKDLRSLINKPTAVRRWGIDEPVHVRWMDANHYFFAKAHIIHFDGGRGLLMLTQTGQDEYSLINNERLEFFFQGLTDNGEYFVEMSFPADMEGLAKEDDGREVARKYNLPENFFYRPKYDSETLRLYRRYTTTVTTEIDSSPDSRFAPSPSKVRAFVESFRIN
jgi:hypothetical protein